jgi:hypothetical protein
MDKAATRRHYETLAKHQYNKRMLELELDSYEETPTTPTDSESVRLSQEYYKRLAANSKASVALRLDRVCIDIEYLEAVHLMSLKNV